MIPATPAPPDPRHIVLLGGGHAHLFVLKAFGLRPERGVRLTLVAKELAAPYSGMLPGFVAGHYSLDECVIDLARLCRFAGATLVHGEAIDIDPASKRVMIAGQPSLPYDVLSIDVGITPDLRDIAGAADHAIAVKPVSLFAPKWQALEAQVRQPDGPRRIAVIGGGPAGFELVLAARHRLRTLVQRAGHDAETLSFSLMTGGALLASLNRHTQRLARKALADASVRLHEGSNAREVTPREVRLADGSTVSADAVLISTKAAPPAWFAGLDVARDHDGFLATEPTLQVVGQPDIFAVGDCATVIEHPRPKAGVFAVRQGPVVADNLRRWATGRLLRAVAPQRRHLSLLSLGDQRAIAAWGPLAAEGRWAWVWKDRIDRAFMDAFCVETSVRRASRD